MGFVIILIIGVIITLMLASLMLAGKSDDMAEEQFKNFENKTKESE